MPCKNTIFPHKCRHLKPKQNTGYTGESGISSCETNPAITRENCENVSPNQPFASTFSSFSHRSLACLAVTVLCPPLLTRSYFLSPFQSFLRQPTGLARSLSQNLTVSSRWLGCSRVRPHWTPFCAHAPTKTQIGCCKWAAGKCESAVGAFACQNCSACRPGEYKLAIGGNVRIAVRERVDMPRVTCPPVWDLCRICSILPLTYTSSQANLA